MVGLVGSEQIYVAAYGTFGASRLNVAHQFPVHAYLRSHALYLLKVYLAVALGHNLRRGIVHSADAKGEYAHRSGWYGDGLAREFGSANVKLHPLLVAQVLQPFIVVDEHEATRAVGTVRPAQRLVVALFQTLRCGEVGIHSGEHVTIVVHKQVQLPQGEVVGIALTELAKRSLKVIGLHGQVVVVCAGGALVLVHGGQLAVGIGAAMIHVVAQQVTAAAQFYHSQRIGVLRIHIHAAVVGRCHSAAKLTGEVGILFVAFGNLFLLLAQSLGGYRRGTAECLKIERLVVVSYRLLGAALPETVGIVAV